MDGTAKLSGFTPGEVLDRMQNDGVLRFVLTDLTVLNPVLFHLIDQPAFAPMDLNQRLAFLMCERATKDAVAQLQALRTSKELQRSTAMFTSNSGFCRAEKSRNSVFNHVMGSSRTPFGRS